MPELRADPDLRKLAEAATPGPWHFTKHGRVTTASAPDSYGHVVCDYDADAALIAALSPDRVLALLDRLAALEGALDRIAYASSPSWDGWREVQRLKEMARALAGTPKP